MTTTPPLTPEQWDRVLANTGLIDHVLTKMRQTATDEHQDAWQDGLLGLARAVQKFDPDRGFQFSTYAVPWIQQGIQRGRGRFMGVSYRAAVDAQRPSAPPWEAPMSLDLPHRTPDGDDVELADLVAAPDDPAAEAVTAAHAEALTALLVDHCRDDIDRDAVDAIAADGPDNQAIGDRHGVTRETVRIRRRNLLARTRRTVDIFDDTNRYNTRTA